MEKEHVTADTVVLVKDLLRKYPRWSHDYIAVVGNISSKNVQEPKAKAALIWMLGEYAQEMQDAPYILESLIENWDEEHSAEVRLHLLTAVMKCFLRRPPETRKALGAALDAGLADFHQNSQQKENRKTAESPESKHNHQELFDVSINIALQLIGETVEGSEGSDRNASKESCDG